MTYESRIPIHIMYMHECNILDRLCREALITVETDEQKEF